MAKLTYRLSKFDAKKAETGVLCVMVTEDVLEGGTISNLNLDGSENSSFLGAGICKYVSSNLFELTIDSSIYQFDGDGNGKSPQSIVGKYKLLFGYIKANLTLSGNAFVSDTTTIVTRGDDGITNTTVEYGKKSYNIIDSLNARDEFAVQALRELMCHIPDPSALSESDMNYYCNIAYKWAANMMQASADARGSFVQETSSSGTSTPTSTSLTPISSSSLTSNSEKIFNNILAVLERTDNVETISEKSVYSKRVRAQIPELITLLSSYLADTDNKILGLKDLISAIKEISNNKSSTTGEISIGDKGIGRDKEHPIYMSGGSFPTKQALASELTSGNIDSFLTFNKNGAVAYSSLSEIKKDILDWLSKFNSLDELYNGVSEGTTVVGGLVSKVSATIDKRVKVWLNHTTIEKNDDGSYSLKVPDKITIIDI